MVGVSGARGDIAARDGLRWWGCVLLDLGIGAA